MCIPTLRSSLVLLAVLSLSGCDLAGGGDPDVAGDYHATTLSLTQNGATTNLLAQGASLRLEVDDLDGGRGTFQGRLVVPGGTEDVDESFSGTYVALGRATRIDDQGEEILADAILNFQTPPGVDPRGILARDVAWDLVGDQLTRRSPLGEASEVVVILERGD